MSQVRLSRRGLIAVSVAGLLSACQVIPNQAGPVAPPPPRSAGPSHLPTDTGRHRVALLVPLSGSGSELGRELANAATMALMDTGANNLRITNYDTTTGAGSAAARALADGNELILGPLLADDIPAVAAKASGAHVPVISYSNDPAAADPAQGVYVMGKVPSQSVARTIGYAWRQGLHRFAALIPQGEYGQRTSAALEHELKARGGTLVDQESYERAHGSILAAARRLTDHGGYDAVMIADSGRIAAEAAAPLKHGNPSARLLGTELWSGEAIVAATPALRGAWFSAVPDRRFGQFAESYRKRFGSTPHRIATLGYDSVLMTLKLAHDWRTGTPLPIARLRARDGFIGLDGPFRFGEDGVAERGLEVREVRAGGVKVVDPASDGF